MPTPIEEVVEKLRASTALLNHAGDELNAIVREVEAFLDSCGIGVYAEVEVSREEDEEGTPRSYTSLGYYRIGSKFRIAIVEGDYRSDPEAKPWSDCPRFDRLHTAKKLPQLISEITKQVEKSTLETRDVAAKLAQELKPILKSGKAAK